MSNPKAELLQMLADRLERISVDSYWAHRASGLRGSLIRSQEKIQAGHSVPYVDSLLDIGFDILEKAAREKKGNSKG
jgi:hypothetical protein